MSISAAEVDVNDSWQSATVGLAIVSGDLRTLDRLLEQALSIMEQAAPEAEVVDTESDIWSFDS